MYNDGIKIKGNREGLNIIINLENFEDFSHVSEILLKKLSSSRNFYKDCSLKIVTQLSMLSSKNIATLKDILFTNIGVKECTFEELFKEEDNKIFSGIYEGKTKFIRKTLRSGQVINYSGNIVVVGDVNIGAQVKAAGNVVVLGSLRGEVHAGSDGNAKAFVAALYLQPSILKIASILTIAPEEGFSKPTYPEVARIKGTNIIVEPYLPNKYL